MSHSSHDYCKLTPDGRLIPLRKLPNPSLLYPEIPAFQVDE